MRKLVLAASVLIALLWLFLPPWLPSKQADRTYEEFRKKDPRYLDRFPGTGSEGNWPSYRYLSWVGWVHQDQSNEHVKVVGGFRSSYQPSCEGTARSRTAWFFGGSTMIGMGSPDDFTIPSLACKELEARDPSTCWRCSNFGMQAYVSSQELLLLYRLLKEARLGKRDRPDLVVFYDGINELEVTVEGHPLDHIGYSTARSLSHDPDQAPFGYWLGGLLTQLRGGRSEPGLPAPQVAAHLEVLARQYAFNYRLISALASANGFSAHFFLQPSLFDKKPLSEFEKWSFSRGDFRGIRFDGELDALWGQFIAQVGKQPFRQTRFARFASLQDSFVGAQESIFHFPNDWVHMNWYGNTLVARRIAEHILRFHRS